MSRLPFEAVLQREMAKCAESILNLPLGDALKLAALQGRYRALETALQQYKESLRLGDEADGI